MIDFGLHKPIRLSACPSSAQSNNVLTSAWSSLEIPNGVNGERAKWVVLSIGQSATPGTPQHIYFMPGQSATDDPASGREASCHILNAFQSPVVLDMAGSSYLHVKAVAISGVQVTLCPIEEDGHGVNYGPMRSPPKIAAGLTTTKSVGETVNVTFLIPTDGVGNRPRFAMVTWDDPTIFLGVNYKAGLSTRWPVMPIRMSPAIFDVHGATNMYFRRAIGSGATNVRITPLENG
jgi:hypothetical protein